MRTSTTRARAGGRRAPGGILQDAGEIEVITPNQGAVTHRHAMIVAFGTEEELRRAISARRCSYRDGERVQELKHG